MARPVLSSPTPAPRPHYVTSSPIRTAFRRCPRRVGGYSTLTRTMPCSPSRRPRGLRRGTWSTSSDGKPGGPTTPRRTGPSPSRHWHSGGRASARCGRRTRSCASKVTLGTFESSFGTTGPSCGKNDRGEYQPIADVIDLTSGEALGDGYVYVVGVGRSYRVEPGESVSLHVICDLELKRTLPPGRYGIVAQLWQLVVRRDFDLAFEAASS